MRGEPQLRRSRWSALQWWEEEWFSAQFSEPAIRTQGAQVLVDRWRREQG